MINVKIIFKFLRKISSHLKKISFDWDVLFSLPTVFLEIDKIVDLVNTVTEKLQELLDALSCRYPKISHENLLVTPLPILLSLDLELSENIDETLSPQVQNQQSIESLVKEIALQLKKINVLWKSSVSPKIETDNASGRKLLCLLNSVSIKSHYLHLVFESIAVKCICLKFKNLDSVADHPFRKDKIGSIVEVEKTKSNDATVAQDLIQSNEPPLISRELKPAQHTTLNNLSAPSDLKKSGESIQGSIRPPKNINMNVIPQPINFLTAALSSFTKLHSVKIPQSATSNKNINENPAPMFVGF